MRIHHIAISVKNLEESVKFYTDNFGFIKINSFTKPHWNGNAVILELDGTQLEIFQFNDAKESLDDTSNLRVLGLKHIAIEVDSVAKKYKELKDKNLDIDKPIKGTTYAWFCFLRDSDGLSIELYEGNK